MCVETPTRWWDISQRFDIRVWSGWQEKQGKSSHGRKRGVVHSQVSEGICLTLKEDENSSIDQNMQFCFIDSNMIFNFRPSCDKLRNHGLTPELCFSASRSTAKTCACWPSFFWTTRHYIMMWSPSCSMLWPKRTTLAVTWLDTFPRSAGSGD